MKKRKLLIAAWIFAGISLAGNAVLLWQRGQGGPDGEAAEDRKAPPAGAVKDAVMRPPPVEGAMIGPEGQGVKMDFSGTAFADDSWKLEEPKPEESVKLDREFNWKEAGLAPASVETQTPSNP
jgi:hypothetical protein